MTEGQGKVGRDTSKSWELYERNRALMATGTGTMSKRPRFAPEEPCYIARGKGCRVWDVDGKEYIDFRNALGPVTLGYCHPVTDEAIQAQLRNGIVFGHPSPLEGEVAERLVRLVPCAEKVRFLKTGGEAIAAAIKASRAATGRDVVFQCGYNGWVNSLAAGGQALPGVAQEAPLGVPVALSRLHRALPWGDLAPWEQAFADSDGQVACAVVAMSYTAPEDGPAFLRGLRELASRHGALLVTDEIVSGFRIAIGGLHDYCGVAVDLAVFSKGMANGMPLSAIVGKADVMDMFEKAVVSSTFSGETLSLAAAKACISLYEEHDVVGHLERMGVLWRDGLNDLFRQYDYPLVCVGMPCCAAFAPREGVKSQDVAGAQDALFRAAYAHGVSLFSVCYTNFSFQEIDITEALGRMDRALGSLR